MAAFPETRLELAFNRNGGEVVSGERLQESLREFGPQDEIIAPAALPKLYQFMPEEKIRELCLKVQAQVLEPIPPSPLVKSAIEQAHATLEAMSRNRRFPATEPAVFQSLVEAVQHPIVSVDTAELILLVGAPPAPVP